MADDRAREILTATRDKYRENAFSNRPAQFPKKLEISPKIASESLSNARRLNVFGPLHPREIGRP